MSFTLRSGGPIGLVLMSLALAAAIVVVLSASVANAKVAPAESQEGLRVSDQVTPPGSPASS